MTDHRFGASAAQASATMNETLPAPSRSAFARATSTAARERSEPSTNARGHSCASARATAPAPVPMSAMVVASSAETTPRTASTRCSVSGRGMRVSGVTTSVERPELSVAGEVGDRLTVASAFHQHLEALRGSRVDACAGVRKEPGAAAVERPAEQDFGVEARRRARRFQCLAGSGKRLADRDHPVADRRRRAHHSSSVGSAPATRV